MEMQFQGKTPSLLRHMATAMRSSRPEEHRIGYKYNTWERVFTEDRDLFEINKRFGESLSRGNVIDLGKEASREAARVRQFAMAVMIWGYGTVGYGATRTSKMLAHPSAVERLIRGSEIVRTGDLADACLFFRSSRGALDQFSWSFFTKYFYFVGMASGVDPMPLILDGNSAEVGVAGGMKQIADAGDPGAVQAMKLWWQSGDRRPAEGYMLFVELVNRWAHDLDCRPDAIEMALWKGFSG